MIQLLALNKIISDKNTFLMDNTQPEHFFNYKDEYLYILDAYARTGEIPSRLEMLEHFPDFSYVSTDKSDEDILQGLQEERIYQATKDFMATHHGEAEIKDKLIQYLAGL